MKKKLLSLLLTLICLFCVCVFAFGCGGGTSASNGTEQTNSDTTKDDGKPSSDDDSQGEPQTETETVEDQKQLTALKATATENLDSSINGLRSNITDETLIAQIDAYYQRAKSAIDAINSLKSAQTTLDQIKADTTAFVNDTISAQLVKLKNAAIAQLDKIVDAGLNKLTDDQLKTELTAFYNTEKAKINAVTEINRVAGVASEVANDTTAFVKQIIVRQVATLRSTVKEYLNQVNQAFTVSPYDYLPEAMNPAYEANLVTAEQVQYDFSGFVSVNAINYGGFGKQWNMVTDNIAQSEFFYKYLNAGNTVMSTALTTVTAYLDSKDADSLDKSFENDNFTASISFGNQVFTYNVEFKKGVQIPLFGTVLPKISMIYDTATAETEFCVYVSDTNRMRYVVTENKYEFGIEYGVEIGNRTSYLSIEKKDSKTEGHIYEYITLKGKDVMPSCADFYIENGYVSVVGNKADAMMGTKGYINELYKADEGKLLGYEVREMISKVSYNTLWFNLKDISGITNIKIGDKTDANKSGKSTNDVYLNDSADLFSPTYNKKLGAKTSRKYDIEFRTRYFYVKDANTGKITELEVKIPMMFIQEDNDNDTNFTDYPADIKKDNGITSEVTLSSIYRDKILADYDALIDDFINNKKEMNSNEIKAFIES